MGIIVWLVMGGLLGWVASMIMGTNAQHGIILNVVVGIVGALDGFLIGPLLGVGSINDVLTITSCVMSLTGAIILLAILSLFQRSRILRSISVSPAGGKYKRFTGLRSSVTPEASRRRPGWSRPHSRPAGRH